MDVGQSIMCIILPFHTNFTILTFENVTSVIIMSHVPDTFLHVNESLFRSQEMSVLNMMISAGLLRVHDNKKLLKCKKNSYMHVYMHVYMHTFIKKEQ